MHTDWLSSLTFKRKFKMSDTEDFNIVETSHYPIKTRTQ